VVESRAVGLVAAGGFRVTVIEKKSGKLGGTSAPAGTGRRSFMRMKKLGVPGRGTG
jgi:hypothetical protein